MPAGRPDRPRRHASLLLRQWIGRHGAVAAPAAATHRSFRSATSSAARASPASSSGRQTGRPRTPSRIGSKRRTKRADGRAARIRRTHGVAHSATSTVSRTAAGHAVKGHCGDCGRRMRGRRSAPHAGGSRSRANVPCAPLSVITARAVASKRCGARSSLLRVGLITVCDSRAEQRRARSGMPFILVAYSIPV